MSSQGSATRFANVLKKASEQLHLPEPTRSRILPEMAADLEDSYHHYLERGYEDDEAVRRAEEAFAVSDEALERLARIHQPALGDVAERLISQVGSWWSKLLLIGLLLFELVFAVRVVTDRSFFVHPSPFLVPVALLALTAFLLALRKLAQIFSRKGVPVRQLRSGLGTLLFCSCATLAVSGLGFLFHLQRFFRVNAEGAPDALFVNFAGWMISISSLMTVALLTAILAALLWFVLAGLVRRAEARELESLLQTAH